MKSIFSYWSGASLFALRVWCLECRVIIAGIAVILILYFFIYAAINQKFLSHNVYDSYTLQAAAWWKGRIGLDHDYSHLELAFWKDNIYVSFPPVPAVVMFALYPFFGEETPSNLVNTLYALLSVVAIYLLCRRKELQPWQCLFWGVFAVLGSNMVFLSVYGGVWFQAQALAFLLSCYSVYFLTSEKRGDWHMGWAFWALSLGCRPFQALFFPILVLILRENLKREDPALTASIFVRRALVFALLPAIIGGALGSYNYYRFGNPIEFGHTHLPAHNRGDDREFGLKYVTQNIDNIFRLPSISAEPHLSFPKMDGFAFYIANPFYIVFFVVFMRRLIKRIELFDIAVIASLVSFTGLLLLHKTMGVWMFGSRYFVDAIPFVFAYLYFKDLGVDAWRFVLASFAVMLNIYGTVWILLDWK
ncbi:MAG: hypothetical protein PHT19_14245 [Methylococcus sp.]|nr:hypothetical protein [Methylococcus sp.]